MSSVLVKVYQNSYKYDKIYVMSNDLCKSIPTFYIKKKTLSLNVNGIQLHYFMKKLCGCESYRKDFINHMHSIDVNRIKFMLIPTLIDTIDYNWNQKMCDMVRERCELDHTLSWLSTLGGAFSALGDYFTNMAETAGKISCHQLQLGARLGDPTVAARCKLYFSLSLIQRHQFKIARCIIYREYCSANRAIVRDDRLIRMCLGIWAKLQYEYEVFKLNRIKNC